MGRYLSCGIADTIYINSLKDDRKDEEALVRIGENIDLSIYDRIDKQNDEYIILKLKREVFEKNIASFIEEQLEFLDDNDKASLNEVLEKIKGKSYDELMEIAKKRNLYGFSYLNGNILCNAAYYLDSSMKSRIFCDMVDILSEGKIIIEYYVGFFSYLRKCIIEKSKNPLKSALILTVIG